MATISTNARNAACDAIVDRLDLGNEAARFILTTVSGGTGTTLAVCTCADPAFGSASAGVATLASTPRTDSSADASGTAAGWALQSMNSGTPTTEISGSIGTGSEDLDIDNASITAGQTVNLNAITVTVPAS